MLTWYQSKVKYQTMVEGVLKTITEEYLHQGVNYGDAETQHYTTLKTRMKNIDVDGLNKARYDEVIFYKGTDEEWSVDPFFSVLVDTGGDKAKYLIPAKDAHEAIKRAIKAHGYGEAKNCKDIKETKLLGVWHPNNELWQGDWWNRMERLLESNRCSWDLNQTEIPFDPPVSKSSNDGQPESDPNAITAMVVRSGVEEVDAEDLGNGYDGKSGVENVRELPDGRTKLIGAPNQTEESQPDGDQDQESNITDSSQSTDKPERERNGKGQFLPKEKPTDQTGDQTPPAEPVTD